MSFATIIRRALPVLALSIALASAQSCFYPDGQTVSSDIPCDTSGEASSCCSSQSFCLSGGLCWAGGIVSRGSCTDKTWGSQACADFCKTDDASGEVAISPCASGGNSNTFVCGLNTTDCQTDSNTFSLPSDMSFTLRPSQVAALLKPVLASQTGPTATVTAAASAGAGLFTTGQLAGVAVGVGLPLLIALVVVIILLRREKGRFSKPKLMYKLPEDHEQEFTFRPPPSARNTNMTNLTAFSGAPGLTALPLPSPSSISSAARSTRSSVRSQQQHQQEMPPHMQSFVERYEAMKRKAQSQERVFATQARHELHSTPRHIERHELGEKRMS